MPLFRYKALSDTGKKVSGVIDADSLELAKERLREAKILVTKLCEERKQKALVLTPPMLLTFTRELKQLLKAGLPLYESLVTIEEKYKQKKIHPLLLDLCDSLKGGNQLSVALSAYPKSFDAIYLSMVGAGEKTGTLPWVFKQLYDLIEKKQRLRKQLVSAMAYPAFLGAFCLIMVIALLLFVIPSMRELFDGRHLHPLTQTILSASGFLERFFLPLSLSIISGLTLLIFFFRGKRGREIWQRLLQRIPLIKTILTEAALIRFCRSTAILLFGGVPLPSALATSRGVMRHPLLEQAIERAEGSLTLGKPLSEELSKEAVVPPLVSRMLHIAEETGKMPEMLQNLSDIYDQELERSLSHITTFLQPALMLVLGGIVGLVILSILLPLTDVSSLIST